MHNVREAFVDFKLSFYEQLFEGLMRQLQHISVRYSSSECMPIRTYYIQYCTVSRYYMQVSASLCKARTNSIHSSMKNFPAIYHSHFIWFVHTTVSQQFNQVFKVEITYKWKLWTCSKPVSSAVVMLKYCGFVKLSSILVYIEKIISFTTRKTNT